MNGGKMILELNRVLEQVGKDKGISKGNTY